MKILPLAGLMFGLCTSMAFAQGNPAALASPGGGAASGQLPGRARGPARTPSPSALPGARAEPAQVVPPSKNVADLPPTEALFDAINRGDLASAKDAVSRGAELNGQNVLGLTPIELAVDLGRNQISFYLLSLRGGIAGSSAGGPPAEPKPPTRAERLAADREARAERVSQSRARVTEAAAPVPQTARLFANDGGSPMPQAGFLGFGSR